MITSFECLSSVQAKRSGEGRNRTYLDPIDEPPTVLKTVGATRHPSLSEESNYANKTLQKDEAPRPGRTTHPVLDNENVLRQTGGARLVGSFVLVHDGILRPLKRASQEAFRQKLSSVRGKTASPFRAIRCLGRIVTFKSKSVEKVNDRQYSVTGELTFHGVTKPLTIHAKLVSICLSGCFSKSPHIGVSLRRAACPLRLE